MAETPNTSAIPNVIESVRALHDYAAPDPSCLSLSRGDTILVHSKDPSGWWDGSIGTKRGWFPSNYIEPIHEVDQSGLSTPQEQQQQQQTSPIPRHRRQSHSSLTNLNKSQPNGTRQNQPGHKSVGSLGVPEPRARGSSLANTVKQTDGAANVSETPATGIHQSPTLSRDGTRSMTSPEPASARSPYGAHEALPQNAPAHLQINTTTHGAIAQAPATAGLVDSRYRQQQQQQQYQQSQRPRSIGLHGMHHHAQAQPPYDQSVDSDGQRVITDGVVTQSNQNAQLPPFWYRKVNPSNGQIYYYNTQNNQTTYDIAEVLRAPKVTRRRSILRVEGRFVANTEKTLPPTKFGQQSGQDTTNISHINDTIDISWDMLINNILRAISDLNYVAKNNIKQRFVELTYQIARAIRDMLASSNTISAESELVRTNAKLLTHHTQIMTALSKLILAAKVASGVWPPPDAANSMRYQAGQVLLAVRHFVALAQESNITLHRGNQPDTTVFDLAGMALSDQELLARLELYSKSIIENLAVVITLITRNRTIDQDLLVGVRECVIHVGELLSIVEDLPTGSSSSHHHTTDTTSSTNNQLNPSTMSSPFLSQLMISKDQLYMYSNDLINLVSGNVDHAQALGRVLGSMLESATHLTAAVESTVMSAKLFIDNRDDTEMSEVAISAFNNMVIGTDTVVSASLSASVLRTRSPNLSNLHKKAMSLSSMFDVSGSTVSISAPCDVSATSSGHNSGGGGGSNDSLNTSVSRVKAVTSITGIVSVPASQRMRSHPQAPQLNRASIATGGVSQPVQRGVEEVPSTAPPSMGITDGLREALSRSMSSSMNGSTENFNQDGDAYRVSTASSLAYVSGDAGTHAHGYLTVDAASGGQYGGANGSHGRKYSGSSTTSHSSSAATGSVAQQPNNTVTYDQEVLDSDPGSLDSINNNGGNAGAGSNAADATNSKLRKFFGDKEVPKQTTNRSGASQQPQHEFLTKNYKPEDISFNMDGLVNGGTFEALVERLTLHDQPVDPGFANAFLMTFHQFATTEDLFTALTTRYNMTPPTGLSDTDLKTWVDKKLVPVQIRVSNALKTWMENHWVDDKDDVVLDRLYQFVSGVVMRVHAPLASRLIEILQKKINADVLHQTVVPRMKRVVVKTEDMPPPILPKALAGSVGGGGGTKRLNLMDIDPMEVARQLTLMEFQIFSRIRPVELMRQEWARKKDSLAVNVRAMSHMSTSIANWVIANILTDVDAKRRALIIKFFIKIADKCFTLNNFNTLLAIQTGLNASTVTRLRKTWDHVSAKTRSTFDNIKRVMDHSRNYAEYRAHLKKISCPALPFLGLFLTDLTFTEDGNPDRRGNDTRLINFDKYFKTSKIIQEVMRYQMTPFALMDVGEIQEFLEMSIERDGKRQPQELYELSLLLEPRETDGYTGGNGGASYAAGRTSIDAATIISTTATSAGPSSAEPPSAGPTSAASTFTAAAASAVIGGAMGLLTNINTNVSTGPSGPATASLLSSAAPSSNASTAPEDPSKNIEQKIRMLEKAGML